MTPITAISAKEMRTIEKHDWALYGLVLCAVTLLPLELKLSAWVPGQIPWLWVALGACLLGLATAPSRWASLAAWLFSMVLGLGLGMMVVGDLLPPGQMVRGDLQRVWDWLWKLIVHRYQDPELPLSYGAAHFWWQSSALFERLATWFRIVRNGGTSADNSALLLSVWFAVWMLSWNAAFQLGRHRSTWASLVPLGIALLLCVGYTGLGIAYARIYLALVLIIAVWANAGRMYEQWVEAGVGVTRLLKRHIFITGLPLAGVILILALAIPYGDYEGTTEFLWDRLGAHLNALYEQWDRAFAGRNPVPNPNAYRISRNVGRSVVPVASASLDDHDIRGGVSTSEEIVFLVKTDDPAPQDGETAPKHYWRERTYDRYTGSGWSSSPTQLASFPGDAPWKEPGYPRLSLSQTFALQRSMSPVPAANEPVVVAENYAIRTRGDGDLAALYTQSMAYNVTSLVPIATESELRSAEQEYADWVKERFLPLPNIPPRIRRLAENIVRRAGAETRYDKAVAIETYLRGFVYDLDVRPPADGVDVVDYYLFTTQRGYCDYSATAMVVMLRSLGIAARYASGYGQGQYDPQLGAWVVRGKNAHAWVEVYFPGFGWIEFEPTASQSPFSRNTPRPTAQPTLASPTASAQPTPPAADSADTASPSGGILLDRHLFPLGAVGGTIIVVVGAIVLASIRASRKPREPRQAIWQVYAQLQRRAQKLGIVPQERFTPREFLGHVGSYLEQRFGVKDGIPQDLAEIAQLYERARYSANPPTNADRSRALAAWERVRHYLRRRAVPRIWSRGEIDVDTV
ncbi:MAG: transglutaminase domain-containing protein [Chloroflexi bacterium]|nr:transglutaminase domain-containing protein [Chloroflexota bacterium]